MDRLNIKGLICLEAGTGAGHMTCYLAKRGAKLVYSISNNQEHLDCARKELPKKYIKNVRFIKADLLKLLGWRIETIELMYDKTPWEKELLEEHLEVIENECKKLRNENLRREMLSQATEILNQVDEDETIYAGTIYSIIARRTRYKETM